MQQRHADYYEGILQLRNPSDEVVKFVKQYIARDKNVAIAKIKKIKNGIDLYLTSNRALLRIGKALQSTFGGQIKRSSKIYSIDKQTSKELYRGTVLYRRPSFGKGDIINFKGKACKVVSMQKKVGLKEVITGRKHSVRFDQI